MTDADTLANAELLWRLVHLVQDTLDKDGELLVTNERDSLARLRKLADECDPEYGNQ